MRIAVLVPLAGLVLPVAAKAATTSFDGTYVGRYQLREGTPDKCGSGGPWRNTVSNGHVTLALPYGAIEADVGPDGRFSGSSMRAVGRQTWQTTMQGQISGRQMEIETHTPTCTVHWSLTKS